MEYSIQDIGGSTIELSFSLGKEKWEDCIQRAYEKNKSKYKIEGFRSGKVPFKLLVNRYGIEIFFEEAMDLAINKYYKEIIEKEEKYEVLDSPEIDVKTISEDSFSVVLTVPIYPIFELGQYTNLTVKVEKTEVGEKEVEKELNKVRESHARWIDVDSREVKDGDRITLDYEGYFGEEKFEGGSAKGATLNIGSGEFIPGFEENLIGAKINDEKDIKVTFPEDYSSPTHAGKEATFKCKILEIKEKQLPELDDEFAKDLGDYETLQEYKEKLRKSLEEKAIENDKIIEENTLLEMIAKSTQMVIPEILVEKELDRLVNDFSVRMAYSGISFQDYLKYIGTDLATFKKQHKDDAAESVKIRIILEGIVKKENISVEKEDVDNELKDLAEKAGKEFEEFVKDIKEDRIMQIMNKLISDKLFDFLRKNNVFEV